MGKHPLKVAFLTTDNREYFSDYKATRPSFGTAPDSLLQGFALTPGLEVHIVSCIRQPVTSPEKLADNTWFHSLFVPKIGWMTTGYQGTIRAARKTLRRIAPDLVHGQGTELDCGMNAVFSGFPSVLTIHGNMRLIAKVNKARPFSFIWLAARLECLAIPRAAGVVCITRYTQNAVSDLARRTWVVPNAVDPSFFEISAAPAAQAPTHLYCIGVTCPRKNQNALIRALDPLAAKRKFKLSFVGEVCPGRPYDEEFLELLRSRPWCVHEGLADREQLKAHLRRASLVVLPSLEDNCPMVVLEAMAAGVPVVAAKVGGLPDLIEEGRTGWFVDPLNPESMSSAVERVLANPGAAAELMANARRVAQERFHPKVIAQRHLEIYHEVLGTGGG